MNRRVIGARQQTRAGGRQADRIPGYDRVETTERARKIRGMDADIRDWPRFFWTWVHIGNIHRRRMRDGARQQTRDDDVGRPHFGGGYGLW